MALTLSNKNKYTIKSQITKYINKFVNPEQVKYIYGGITEEEIEYRKTQHIRDNKPEECNKKWKIISIPNTSIDILSNNHELIEEYKTEIEELENHLIAKLNKKYELKCVNARDKDNTIQQTGGRGLNIQLGDEVKFYIFYELK